MITRVVLAKLSPTMEEGTIVAWHKQVGDAVKVGDVLAEIETDKANMEMEALGAGILRAILVAQGEKAPVGDLIGIIADANDDISQIAAAPRPASQTQSAPAPAPSAAPVAVATVDADTIEPAAIGGRIKASPLARKMAAAAQIPLTVLRGSGPAGRIIKRDIEAHIKDRTAPAAPARPALERPSVKPGEIIAHTRMRQTIARRLSESFFKAPHFYVTCEVDMDAAAALREQLLRGQDLKVSYNDLILKACAKALLVYPQVNATWTDDAIRTYAHAHLGVAVALADGLITPVVRHAERKSVIEISREVKDLAAKARAKRLTPEEYMGSTFTISNLGMYDVTAFTAIINPPESAILSIGSVRAIPVVDQNQIRAGQRMQMTLGSDHRVIDGALAAQFLAELRKLLENPVSLFV
ncbi:MAG: 2-oxo acid dehydrogenase subunit E2 [Vicinamibacteria bacterium]|jgi:pyruvate dehydrogenase E2 component (dihydrolipoamide acetyltransferase)|nr:2-oxo acid dehydrogenase subunit E2 [Vicinamibacteria bacterium]